MTKLKINNTMKDEDINWKKIPCKCDKSDIEKCFPIGKCKHCQCQQAENSLPRNTFDFSYPEMKDDKPTGKTLKRKVKEITIVRSQDGYDSILGWTA